MLKIDVMYFRFFIEGLLIAWLECEKLSQGLTFSSENWKEDLCLARMSKMWVYQPTRYVSRKVWAITERMVPPARFQRATFRLGGGRSMQLGYGSKQAQ